MFNQIRRCPTTGRPLPPPYWELYTDEARDDPTHPNHCVFTPPPPFQYTQILNRYTQYPPIPLTTHRDDNFKPLYTPNPTVPQHCKGQNNVLIKFAPGAINYKAQLRRLARALCLEYMALLQSISTPQPSPQQFDAPKTPFQPHLAVIDDIFSNLTNIVSLLREHQAKEEILVHIRHETELNRKKAILLNLISDSILTTLKTPDAVSYDEILTLGESCATTNTDQDKLTMVD